VAAALLAAGTTWELAAVCSRLGFADESVTLAPLAELAVGTWEPLSVLVLSALDRPGVSGTRAPTTSAEDAVGPTLAWGLDDDRFAHRGGMVTKSEIRAVALGKLGLPPSGTFWDIGAGSGSVAIECSRLVPDLDVYAIEERPDDVTRLRANVCAHDACVTVVEGRAPADLAQLPDPDRIFVGGGGIDVLDAALARLRPGGRIVATYAALDRAAAGAERLGNVVQIGVQRGSRLPDGGWRLAATNPVFIAWGPGVDG